MNSMPVEIQSLPVLRIHGLTHRLAGRGNADCFTIHVEQCLEFYARDIVGLLGPSGCGKTTLLSILGLLRSPSDLKSLKSFDLFVPDVRAGDSVKGIDIRDAWVKRDYRLIEGIRREHFGFALQSGELVSSLNVEENISIPLRLNNWDSHSINARVKELIEQFRLNRIGAGAGDAPASYNVQSDTSTRFSLRRNDNSIARSRVNHLSGGEYQRVALARSIAHRPTVVFVDEPTSALNRELAHGALSELRELQRSRERAGITVMITHDEELAKEFCNVLVRMAPRRGEAAGEVVDFTRLTGSNASPSNLCVAT